MQKERGSNGLDFCFSNTGRKEEEMDEFGNGFTVSEQNKFSPVEELN